MDSIDSAYLWAAFSLPLLAMTLLYLRSRYNELIALHLVVFWLQMFAYGLLWLWSDTTPKPFGSMSLIGLELTLYAFFMLLFATRLRGSLIESALAMRWLWVWPTAFIVLTVLMLHRYGGAAFATGTGIAEMAGVPRWILDIYGLLALPAWGAFFCCCIKVANGKVFQRVFDEHGLGNGVHGGRRRRTSSRSVIDAIDGDAIVSLIAAAVFFGIELVAFSGGGFGGKRAMLVVGLVLLLFVVRRPFRFHFREVAICVIALPLIVFGWHWYEMTRGNFHLMLMGGGYQYADASDMVVALVTEDNGRMNLSRDLAERETPLSYLLTLDRYQDRVAHGAIVGQALNNVLPGGLVEKSYLPDPDAVASFYQLPYGGDSPMSLFAELGTEVSALTVVLTPLLYVALFWAYLALLSRSHGMLSLALIGVLVNEAGNVQTNLSAIFGDMRSLALFLVISLLINHAWRGMQVYLSLPSRLNYESSPLPALRSTRLYGPR